MKILYISAKGIREDLYDDDNKEYDLTKTSDTITDGILQHFNDVEIVHAKDITTNDGFIPEKKLDEYDLYLCDMTTSNPSVIFVAGLVKGMGKPIILFKSSEGVIIPSTSYIRYLLYSEASLDNEFRNELNNLIEKARKDPDNFKSSSTPVNKKPKAFISYSHNDKSYLYRLMIHLKPLERKGLIDIWQDTKIKTGDKWEERISKALSESNIAILLISADFMASDFIVKNELPPLLSKAEVKGTKILPVILSHCRFSREPTLNRFQAANSPNQPLSVLSEHARESVYDKVAMDIESALLGA